MFDRCIIAGHDNKSKDRITVKCYSCGDIRNPVYSEHMRSCNRQSKYVDEYLCPKCLKSDVRYKSKIIDNAKKLWSKEEYKKKARKANSCFHKSRDKNYWSKHREMCQTQEFRKKCSDSIKEKFKNDTEYVDKVTAARKKYWCNEEYRDKQRVINEKRRRSSMGIYSSKPKISSLNKILYSILDDLDIKYVPEYKIGFYHFDCFLVDYNILIECNGDYFHNTPVRIKNDKCKTTYINRYFPQLNIKTIWEHEFLCKDKVIQYIRMWTGVDLRTIDFNFNDLNIDYVDNKRAVEFIQKYHYTYSIGHGRSQIRYGCFINDILIAVCLFANPTRNESHNLLNVGNGCLKELVRLCRHPLYDKKNFMSWFLSRCLKKLKCDYNDVTHVLTFADKTFGHSGSIYKACNFRFNGVVPKSYWYIDRDGYVMHKKTLYNHARKMGVKESVYANMNNYKRVWGLEKLRFIYEY